MNLSLKPTFGLSGSILKVIAMISMVIDHIALYLMEDDTILYETMRCIGRIAFSCLCLPYYGRVYSYKKQVQVFLYSAGLCSNQ